MKNPSWGKMIPPRSLSMYLENVHGHVSDMTGRLDPLSSFSMKWPTQETRPV